jgi:hypothetical protein
VEQPRRERGTPLAIGDMRQRQARAQALDTDGDEAEAGPRVKPPMKKAQLRGTRGELQEAERGAECSEAAVGARGHRVVELRQAGFVFAAACRTLRSQQPAW